MFDLSLANLNHEMVHRAKKNNNKQRSLHPQKRTLKGQAKLFKM